MKKDKKMAAALAAVAAYIKSEQEARMMMPAQPGQQTVPTAVPIEKSFGSGNSWSLSGRQAQMQNRGLMQMKLFHGRK